MIFDLYGLLRLEARRSAGLLLFPFVVLAVWFLSDQGRARGIWLWPDVSLSIESTVVLVAPLAAGIAAWTASRNRRLRMEELLATTPRPQASRDLASWAATTIWFVLAYAMTAGCVHVLAYLDGAWGLPVLWPVLVGLLAIVAHSSLGYAAGCYLPSIFTAPLVAISVFLLQATPVYFEGSAHHLSPLGESLTRSVFHGVLPNLFVEQSLWLLGLSGIGLSAVVIRQRRSVVSFGFLLAAISIAALGVGLLLNEPPWASPKQMKAATVPYDPVCVREEIPICVHPAYKALLPETVEVVGGIASPLVGVPGGPERAEQINSIFAAPEPDRTLTFFLHDRASLGDNLASQVAGGLVGLQASAAFEGTDGTADAQVAIQAWLLRQAGRDSEYVIFAADKSEAVAAAVQRFSELDTRERKEWLRENYTDLRTGKLTLGDLP